MPFLLSYSRFGSTIGQDEENNPVELLFFGNRVAISELPRDLRTLF